MIAISKTIKTIPMMPTFLLLAFTFPPFWNVSVFYAGGHSPPFAHMNYTTAGRRVQDLSLIRRAQRRTSPFPGENGAQNGINGIQTGSLRLLRKIPMSGST